MKRRFSVFARPPLPTHALRTLVLYFSAHGSDQQQPGQRGFADARNHVATPRQCSQAFPRLEHIRVLGKLPREALNGLRYYEVASLAEDFKTYPPLQGGGIGGKGYVHVVVTDWSLLFLSTDGNYDKSVLLELPFLGIERMVSGMACSCTIMLHARFISQEFKNFNGSDLLNIEDEKSYKTTLISIHPKAGRNLGGISNMCRTNVFRQSHSELAF